MTTQEQIAENSKKIKALQEILVPMRKSGKPSSFPEYKELSEQLQNCFEVKMKLHWQRYYESLNCKACEDSGMVNQCCSDEDCQSNVICYECDVHLQNEEE